LVALGSFVSLQTHSIQLKFMGEREKKIGEDGEKKVRLFFEKIGWTPMEQGIDMDCLFPDEHKLTPKSAPRATHGIDFIFSYVCPLIPTIRRNILISVKDSFSNDTKPRNTAIKTAIKDLGTALKCFKKHPKRKALQGKGEGVTAIEDIGVLVKLNKDPITAKSFLGGISKAENVSVEEQSTILFVENSRFDFIENSMQFIDREYKEWGHQFYLPKNSVTISGEKRRVSSKLLPVQSLSGGPLAFRLEMGEETKLLITSEEPFSQSRFRRYCGMALDLSSNWASVIIAFPDFRSLEHAGSVREILQSLSDKSYANKITCVSLNPSSRLQ
jgi:hypothetical protein